MKKRLIVLFMLIPALLLAACGSDENNDETPTDTTALINNAADELDNASSFQFVLTQTGAETFFIFGDLQDFDIVFGNAVATFVSPDRVKADFNVRVNANTVKAEILAVGTNQYLNLSLLTGNDYVQDVYVEDFQPSDLISSERGLGSALRNMQNVEFIGNEDILGGIAVYHLRGTIIADRVRSVTVGLMATETGDIVTDLYIRRDGTNRVALIELQEPSPPDAEEDLSKTWVIEFRGYNQEYTIVEPTTE